MFTAQIAHIRRYVNISDDEAQLICSKLRSKALKKKEFLLKPGKVCRATYFVSKGLIRLYFINKKDHEQITHFGLEGWWITDYDSLDTQKPARFYLQALEESEVMVWDIETQAQLARAVPQLETYFRIIMQRAYAASQRRIEFLHNNTDEERYRNFSSWFPEFVQRVPQYMLASYLGFTPQFLSKIRGKKVWGEPDAPF